MTQYLLKQLAASVLVLFIVVSVTFFILQMAPGSLGLLADPNMDPAVAENIRRNYGLDEPVLVQYGKWIGNLLRGDLGMSLMFRRPVLAMILERLPLTLVLGGAALLVTLVVGIGAGIVSARKPNSLMDQVFSFVSFVGLAIPNFWLGIMLIILFSVQLGWLPSSGTHTIGQPFSLLDRLSHLTLPALVLATSTAAELMRFTRSSWLDIQEQDYVRTARSKGLGETAVQGRHVMKNAMIPVLTIFGLFLTRLLGGTAIIESLFAWPGMGSMAVNAAVARDAPLVLGITIFVAAGVILSNLLIDALYPLFDPRVRY